MSRFPSLDSRAQRWVWLDTERRIDAAFSSQHDTLMREPTHYDGIGTPSRTIVGRVVRWARARGRYFGSDGARLVTWGDRVLVTGGESGVDPDDNDYSGVQAERRMLAILALRAAESRALAVTA